eukprot:CAMPEP_0170512570 /NCGR_PEP_ID=MMETSP0208-20121228/66924_1 /TAXON_ID=197538 /ORGANISM="Strombidium inclinatum, Strain S3" /LENGTH=96 /DNA_ID=CAMNT_0010796215 /DNA_START=1186 /DNA_END=1472 /DNA_ORIENTATION=+
MGQANLLLILLLHDALGMEQLILDLAQLEPLEEAEGGPGERPVDEHPQFEQEGQGYKPFKEPLVFAGTAVHHEIALHELRNPNLNLKGAQGEVQAV